MPLTLPPERPICLRSRRPPQSNCPPAAVPAPDNGARLETESEKGGISTVPPPSPQGRHQRLPPILRITDPIPTTGYSKAPRGLFVLPRVGRIFTASSISPSPSLRQRSSRYAIRAGRNLPDKEFRYLRTVIVTAAVHRGFSSSLISPPFNLPAPGRCQPLYLSFRFGRDLCFC